MAIEVPSHRFAFILLATLLGAGGARAGQAPAASAGAAGGGSVGSIAVGDARTVFNGDLLLEQAIVTAVERNLNLKVQESLTRTAEEDIAIERAAFDPAFRMSSSVAERVSPSAASDLDGADKPESTDEAIDAGIEQLFPTGTSLDLSSDLYDRNRTNSSFARINPEYNAAVRLNLTQPLLRGAGSAVNLAPLRLAYLDHERSQIDLRDELINLLLDTEQAYWTVVASASAEEIRRNALDLAGLLVEEATARREVNLATPVDVLEAQAAAAERREALLIAVAATHDAKDRLFQTLGILPTAEPGALDLQPLPEGISAECDPVQSFTMALEHAPESLIYQNAIRAREIELARARRNRLPQLDLNLNSGILGRGETRNTSYRRLTDRDGYFWEALVEVRVPWGFRLEKAQLEQAREALRRELINRQNAELQLYADIRVACRAFELAEQRVKAAAITAELNRKRFEQTKVERDAGESTMRDLLEAQEAMEEAELRVIEAKVDLLSARAALSQLEGTLPERHGIDFRAFADDDPLERADAAAGAGIP